MKDQIREMLNEAISSNFDTLRDCENEDERKKVIENLDSLYKLRVEELKIEQTRCDKLDELEEKQREFDQQFSRQSDEKKIDFILQAAQIALTIGSWAMFSIWQSREQKFEMNGTPTTPIYRSLLSKIVPSLRK